MRCYGIVPVEGGCEGFIHGEDVSGFYFLQIGTPLERCSKAYFAAYEQMRN